MNGWQIVVRDVVDKCSQPAKEAGSCGDWVLRYSYVSSSGDCESFYYGGCEGNDNRFESADECEAECSGVAAATTRPPARTTQRPHLPDRTAPPIGCFPRIVEYVLQLYCASLQKPLDQKNLQSNILNFIPNMLFSSSYYLCMSVCVLACDGRLMHA